MPAVDTLLECLRLKSLERAGWVRTGVPSPESVAAHSWGVAWLVLVLAPPQLDRARALSYAVLHDLPEVRVGDLTPADGVAKAEKARREQASMAGLAAGLGDDRLLALWNAYEAQADDEARFVRELDRLDMALQAVAHHEAGHPGMRQFLDSAAEVVRHPALRPLFDALAARVAR